MSIEWKKRLRREASAYGMCRENRDALESLDTKEEAIALYKKTIDWALEKGYPRFSTIQRDFCDCERYGIFVNKVFHGELLDDQQVYVFHHCSGRVRTGLNVGKKIIPMMYFANGCDITISGAGPAGLAVRVPLYVFGQNSVFAQSSEDVVFTTYKFDVDNE